MTSRGLTFGSAPAAYERFRPGYPSELVSTVLRYAGEPVGNALEIGAGTGKATRVFLAHGIAVTVTDPDPAMLAELRRHIPDGPLKVLHGTLEELPATPQFDMVYAAASLHWTKLEGRWQRIADRLRPGGVFASFGGPVFLADRAVEARVAAARRPFLEYDGIPSPDGTPPEAATQWPGTELIESEFFSDVRQEVFPRQMTWTPNEFVGYLSTVSAYLQLPVEMRTAALDAIRQVLPEAVEVKADIWLHLARRTSAQ